MPVPEVAVAWPLENLSAMPKAESESRQELKKSRFDLDYAGFEIIGTCL